MQMDEDAETCARRELEEETGLKCVKVEQFGTFSDVNRNPIKYSFNKESYEQMKAKGYRLEF